MSAAEAQHFNWAVSEDVNYTMNYENPYHLISAAGNDRVYTARTETGTQPYSRYLYGTAVLDAYSESGQLLWSRGFGNLMVINSLTSDGAGNVYAAGQFMESFISDQDTLLTNTGTGFNLNVFLMSFDKSGNLRWIHNKIIPSLVNDVLQTIALDPGGQLYYVMQDWNESRIIPVDSAGNDLPAITIQGSRVISSIDFDEYGNLFVAGSTESGTLTVAGTSTIVPETYMMFLARINTSRQLSWVRLAHDVTFQSPVVASGNNGHVWLSGVIMDSTSWGNVHFNPSNWSHDIFLTRCDSLGNFLAGTQVPASNPIQGDFRRGQSLYIDTDASDNVYVFGRTRGLLNWGNNVITGTTGSTNTELSLLSFDTTATARWEIGSACNAAGLPMNIIVRPDGECFFAASVIAPASFGMFTLNGNGGQAAVFGRISPGPASNIINEPLNGSQERLSVWPNPATEWIYVNIPGSGLSEGKYFLVNGQGQTVRSGSLNANQKHPEFPISHRISTASLSPGLYQLVFPPYSSVPFLIR